MPFFFRENLWGQILLSFENCPTRVLQTHPKRGFFSSSLFFFLFFFQNFNIRIEKKFPKKLAKLVKIYIQKKKIQKIPPPPFFLVEKTTKNVTKKITAPNTCTNTLSFTIILLHLSKYAIIVRMLKNI